MGVFASMAVIVIASFVSIWFNDHIFDGEYLSDEVLN